MRVSFPWQRSAEGQACGLQQNRGAAEAMATPEREMDPGYVQTLLNWGWGLFAAMCTGLLSEVLACKRPNPERCSILLAGMPGRS